MLPRTRGRSPGARVLDADVEAVIIAIAEFYLDQQRPTVAALVREVARRCAGRGLTTPTYNAVAPRIRALDRQEVLMHMPKEIASITTRPWAQVNL